MTRLFINYFICPDPQRHREYIFAMSHNLHNPAIDRVHVLGKYHTAPHPKIDHFPCEGQPTYRQFFDLINNVASDGDISIVANLDIYFDDTIAAVHHLQPHQCYALSRWDGGALVQVHGDSQDAWIFRGKVRPVGYADFTMGTFGCDNRIAHELNQAGYVVLNPCHTIKSHHVHNTDYRQHDHRRPDNTVPQPYFRVPPCHL